MEWFLLVFKKYAEFNGRSRRKEYWMFGLFSAIASFLLQLLDSLIGLEYNSNGLLSSVYSLLIFIPSLAVTVRRLHDVNKSGWYFLLWLLPIIGWIWIIILLATDGDRGKNQYGLDPKNEFDELDQIGLSEN